MAEVTEDGGCGGCDDSERQAETEALHAQFARNAREIVADGS